MTPRISGDIRYFGGARPQRFVPLLVLQSQSVSGQTRTVSAAMFTIVFFLLGTVLVLIQLAQNFIMWFVVRPRLRQHGGSMWAGLLAANRDAELRRFEELTRSEPIQHLWSKYARILDACSWASL